MEGYPPEIEHQMQRYYQSLSEKDSRRYAAIEAVKLGYGGVSYIRTLLGCAYYTITLGMNELNDETAMAQVGVRQAGGGRKSVLETVAHLDATFLQILAQHTAGSPMDETVKWTNLTRSQIADLLKLEGIEVSVTVVDQLLAKHDFRKRQAFKTQATGTSTHRNEQFEKIADLVEQYQHRGEPVVSMDTKKKS
jgi:Rhodopirellula transposase DDE domain